MILCRILVFSFSPIAFPRIPSFATTLSSMLDVRCSLLGSLHLIRLVLFLDFTPHLARDTGPDKTVNEVKCEECRQDIIEELAQQQEKPKNKRGDDCLGESAGRAQAERFERGIFHRAYHHG